MLDKLEYIIALAREKHFGRAAESCGVAQPTLSLGIQSLEQTLNAPLVIRSSRFRGFTPEGERVLVWARRLVGDAHAMRQEIFGLQRGIGAHIRLAAVPSAMPLVAALVGPFQERHPGVRFTVLTRPSDVLLTLLEQRDIDIGMTYLHNEPIGDVTAVALEREHYMLLTTANGPFGDSPDIRWAEVGALPLCLLTRELQHRRIVDSVLRTAGIEPAPMIETDSIYALSSHVQTGRWVSVIPRSIVLSINLGETLRAIPIVEPEITHTIGLVVSNRFPIQPTIASLLNDARRLAPPDLNAAVLPAPAVKVAAASR